MAERVEEEFEQAFSHSLARSRERRRRAKEGRSIGNRARRIFSALGRVGLALAAIGLAGTTLSGDPGDRIAASRAQPAATAALAAEPSLVALSSLETTVPDRHRLRAAIDYARRRAGLVSVAVVDSDGELHGWRDQRRYVSASVVKTMLLAAELERVRREGLELDATTRDLLERMITWSDNEAADAIYARVGDEGLYEVAEAAGMRDFSVAGHWAVAQISARDMAGFMFRIRDTLERTQRGFAMGLLGGIVNDQRWGIPDEIDSGWRVYFKGGWRETELGQLVHQTALLERDGQRIAIAVLTDAQPTHDDGVEVLRGVAARLAG